MLQARVLLEGSTQHDGSRARITARLVDTATEVHLWAETCKRIIECPLSVQADVGSLVAQVIRETLPSPRTAALWR